MVVRDDLAFEGLATFASLSPLRDLGALVLGDLLYYAVGQLAFRGIVAAIIEGTDLRAILRELLAQEVEVRGLTSQPVAVLGEHHRDTASHHEITYPIQTGPLQR